jgi:predicted transposase YdaD
MNMLMAEWNMDDALAVRYEEGLERGMELGLEQGLERGREQGLEQGREEAIRRILRHGMSPAEAARIFTIPLDMVMRYVDAANYP